MEHIFNAWDTLREVIKERSIVLFLDFDGTLSSIVERPEKAVMAGRTRNILKKISQTPGCKVAIISGRAIADLKERVGLDNIIYSGNHGLELSGPKIRFRTPVGRRYKDALRAIKNELREKISAIEGAFVEDKGFSLSLHYRLADKKKVPLLKTIFQEVTLVHKIRNTIKTRSGKKVFEVRPSLEWDKGKIVLFLLAREKFALPNRRNFPIYIGDDTTDEDAFKALRNKGATVFVGRPRTSEAKYYLNNTREVTQLLSRIAALKGRETELCRN